MPSFGKSVMSRFFRGGCEKRAKLELYQGERAADERAKLGMPVPDKDDPTARMLKKLGDEWEKEKLKEICNVLGRDRLRCVPKLGGKIDEGEIDTSDLDAAHMLPSARIGDFLAQARFGVRGGSFAAEHGLSALGVEHDLDCQEAVPDLILVYKPQTYSHRALASGRTEALADTDGRLQLRIIDIKVTETPGANYFAEIAYYTMALAGWLQDKRLDDRFVVVPHGAIWPGSQDASALEQARSAGVTDHEALVAAVESELLEAPFSIFAALIRAFIRRDLPRLLDADWRTLDWHVGSHCKGCAFLGHDWHPSKKVSPERAAEQRQRCMPTAQTSGHLSLIPFMPRGARRSLEERGIDDIEKVAIAAEWAGRGTQGLHPEDRDAVEMARQIFSGHRALKTGRTIIAERAVALTTPGYQARIAADTRTSAAMPRWSGLKIYITVTFDMSSTRTLAFGVSAFWSRDQRLLGAAAADGMEPTPTGEAADTPVEPMPDWLSDTPWPDEQANWVPDHVSEARFDDEAAADLDWEPVLEPDWAPEATSASDLDEPEWVAAERSALEPRSSEDRQAPPVDAPQEPGSDDQEIIESTAEVDRRFAETRRAVYGGRENRDWHHWPASVFIVAQDGSDSELTALVDFLRHIDGIIRDPRVQGTDGETGQPSTYQLYLWDNASYEHLRRVVGRHLDSLVGAAGGHGALEHLYNIFPAVQQMRGEQLSAKHSPYTIVKAVVEPSLAAPIPHYYSLLNVARHYNMIGNEAAERMLRVSSLFDDPLSDHIPSEKAWEIWRAPSDDVKERRCQHLGAVMRKHLIALSQVTERLERDMRQILSGAAPTVPDLLGRGRGMHYRPRQLQPNEDLFRPLEDHPTLVDGEGEDGEISEDGKLWLAYARLNASLSSFEVDTIRAMPVFEREARGKAARLERRLFGREEAAALRSLGLAPTPGRRVYRMAETSREVSARRAEISWALAPAEEAGFLDRGVKSWFRSQGLEVPGPLKALRRGGAWRLEDLTAVSIAALDRTRCLVVLDASLATDEMDPLDLLEQTGGCDLTNDVVLDPIHVDFFIPKLERALRRIGNPDVAQRQPLSEELQEKAKAGVAEPRAIAPVMTAAEAHLPVADVLWNARALERAGSTDTDRLLAELARRGIGLNEKQRTAFAKALSRRIHLVWGPPGTGKSHTIGAVIVGALLDCVRRGARLRILVTAATWTAIDNILRTLPQRIGTVIEGPQVRIARVRSPSSRPPGEDCADFDLALNRSEPDLEAIDLKNRLVQWNPTSPDISNLELTVVGATAHQVSNLVSFCGRHGKRGLFDLVIVDEASQMDVGTSAVALQGLARDGRLVCAGDWLQLPPIQQAKPPEGLAPMLGSIYEFLLRVHGIEQTALAVNHRSNAEIVGFFRQAGYERLSAHSQRLRIRLEVPIPKSRPDWWPGGERDGQAANGLPWSPHWSRVLDPAQPLSCIIHEDGRSSQTSLFEAQAIAALVVMLAQVMLVGLSGEIGHDGQPKAVEPDRAYRDELEQFFREAVGIVTPHRAQQGLVIAEIQKHFDRRYHELIRGAVDTVERFQGQERDVMLCSFAMGDMDAIGGEEEFLYSLNRFNVLASRPRAKLIVLMSAELVDHLAGDLEVMKHSRLLKHLADPPEENRLEVDLPWFEAGEWRSTRSSLRWHDGSTVEASEPRRLQETEPSPGPAVMAMPRHGDSPTKTVLGAASPSTGFSPTARGGLDGLEDDFWTSFAPSPGR